MDAFGDELFVFEAVLEGGEGRIVRVLRLVEAAQVDALSRLADEVEELLSVGHLLQRLYPHPACDAGQIFRLEVAGHRHVEVGRKEFVFHLLVQSIE